jgi:Ca2+-transporting ATPase
MQGERVIAFAYKIVDQLFLPLSSKCLEGNVELAGLVAIADPAREEVKDAISACVTAGITPVMITGDHPSTAAAIARHLGLIHDKDIVMTGKQLKSLSAEAFLSQVDNIRVYARVSPEQKLQIVRTLQQKGHFVSMTGDGVNDAPSLRAANIGVAMGVSGSDVSKEAAHMILLDDNFATIIRAIKEGRRIYDNIRKFVKYILTCNSAEIWTLFAAPLAGLPVPLQPIHVLWINLVTDGLPGLALANERAELNVMTRPPRKPNESLFAQGIGAHIIWVGLLMAGLSLGVQALAVYGGHANWQTMVFTVLSLSQLAHVMAIRSDTELFYSHGPFRNMSLLTSLVFTTIVQMIAIYAPFANRILQTQPLTALELLLCFGAAAILFHAVELEKWIRLRRKRDGN